MPSNRLLQRQSDYVFLLVRPPAGWQPLALDDHPPAAPVIYSTLVASREEAMEDLLRSNHLALRQGLNVWAVVRNLRGQG